MESSPQDRFASDGFRLRGIAVGRVEAFSDSVFAVALTLLVVSLEVPRTYAQLETSLKGFLGFAVCFAVLMSIWRAHYGFFRRFGLQDERTILLNAALLFVTLFYVYPLKFLFTVASEAWTGNSANQFFAGHDEVIRLMVVYGIGFTAVRLVLAGLFVNGYAHRAELELTPTERALTRSYIFGELAISAVGLFSAGFALALPPQYAGLTGWSYLLIWPARRLTTFYQRRQLRRASATSS